MNNPSLKHPSFILLFLLSFISIFMMLVHFLIYGIVHETDEGTLAHIFQLFIFAQAPLVSFFYNKIDTYKPKKNMVINCYTSFCYFIINNYCLFINNVSHVRSR